MAVLVAKLRLPDTVVQSGLPDLIVPLASVTVRKIVPPSLRSLKKDVQPSPLLGRKVPVYVAATNTLAGADGRAETALEIGAAPLVMASYTARMNAPVVTAAAEKLDIFPTYLRVAKIPASRSLTALTAKTDTLQLSLPLDTPDHVTAAISVSLAAFSVGEVGEIGIFLPFSTLEILRTIRPAFPAQLALGPAPEIASLSPSPFVEITVPSTFEFSNLVINAPSSVESSALNALMKSLLDKGFPVGTPHIVELTISETNIRYFHSVDAESARAIADLIRGRARDFTSYRPSPPVGTVEVWLSGSSGNQTTALPSQTKPAARTEDLVFNSLRDRLIESLRNGDSFLGGG
ncbi:MAG: hypothetical protein ACU0C9_12755 [Paracoccaceae bacterium]